MAEDGKLFPVYLRIVDGRAFVSDNYSGNTKLRPGLEILSLNGRSMAEWLAQTGEYVSADEDRSDMAEIAKAYGQEVPNFDHGSAPERGRLEGERDFSEAVTYYNWHVFRQSKKDRYGLSG